MAARASLDYRSELRQTDVQAVGSASLLRLGTKSVTAAVTLSAADGRVAAEIELVVVAIDGKGGASRPLTEGERTALSA